MKDYVYKKRLLALADFLNKLPEEKFDYSSWFFSSEDIEYDYETVNRVKNRALKNSCGTTGCALGWACAMPRFQRLGLKWGSAGPQLEPDLSPIESAAELFGVSISEAEFLFYHSVFNKNGFSSPDCDASPQEVATHLREFAHTKWPCKKG